MAWRCSGSNHASLVSNMKRAAIITNKDVESAMLMVDRKNYVTASADPYEDSPQYIGYDATISAPHMHASCLELLVPLIPKKDAHYSILDVGSGSGYLVATLARMRSKSTVIGIDYVQDLVELSRQNMMKQDSDLLLESTPVPNEGEGEMKALEGENKEKPRVQLVCGNGWEGWPESAPYDIIHVGAAAKNIPPTLLKQLKVGGRMIIPVGEEQQELVQVDRLDAGETPDCFSVKSLMGVRYVPLVNGTYQQYRR